MKTMFKSALFAVSLGSAVVALAACSSTYYRTGYYSSGYAYDRPYVYDRPAVVYETSPSYVVTNPSYVVANPPATVVASPPATVVTQTYADNCATVYRSAYCTYPRFGGTV